MRETTLGRWMARIAVTVGAGVIALGLSAAVAQARGMDSEASSVNLVGTVNAVQPNAVPLFVTESWDWG